MQSQSEMLGASGDAPLRLDRRRIGHNGREEMPETIEILVSRLERTAAELRSGDLEPQHAAALVDDLARIAAEAGGELDRHVRLGDQPLGPAGQLAFSS
jgi:hypothetical protein